MCIIISKNREGLIAQIEEESGLSFAEFKKRQNRSKMYAMMKRILYYLIFPLVFIFNMTKNVISGVFNASSSSSATSNRSKKGGLRSPTVFLIDNGSLRPKSTRTLRMLAERVSLALGGVHVDPVSVRW